MNIAKMLFLVTTRFFHNPQALSARNGSFQCLPFKLVHSMGIKLPVKVFAYLLRYVVSVTHYAFPCKFSGVRLPFWYIAFYII